MPKRVSSRLAKKKQKEMARQSFVFLALAIIISLVFVVVVLPNAVKLFFDILDQETALGPIDTIPPQPPMIAAPPEATSSAKIKLSGYGEASLELYVVVNNQEQAKKTINDNGQFEITAKLEEGPNLVKFYSVDEAGNESATKGYQILMDIQKPEIKIGYPEDGANFELTEERIVNIQGETEARAKVFIDEHLVYADNQGRFNYRYRLDEGENKIMIRAIDRAGNDNEFELTIGFRD